MRQKHAPAEPDDLIGPRTAASIIGISTTALHKLDSVLQPSRLLGRRVYSRSSVEAFAGARDVKRVALARKHASRASCRAQGAIEERAR